jgi:DNA-binding NarL/FixJ family response regulator
VSDRSRSYHRIPLTADQRQAIARLYQDGTRVASIADQIGRALGTVKNVVRDLHAAGVGRRYAGTANV